MKKFLRILLVLIVVGLLGWFSVQRYLHSRHVAAKVAAHLQDAYGGNVKLDEVDVGIASSALHRLEFFELECATGPSSATPWLSIGSFSADVSIFDLLKKEAMPTRVKVAGPRLFLRLSKDGKLLTCLPDQLSLKRLESAQEIPEIGAFPLIEVEDGEVTLHTDGAPDLTMTKVSLKIEKKKDRLVVSGNMTAEAGAWSIHGDIEPGGREPTLLFSGKAAPATLRQQLPFVPAAVWPPHAGTAAEPIQLRVVYDFTRHELRLRLSVKAR